MSYLVPTRDDHFHSRAPKRILCLDGGGIRGLFSLGVLERIESLLRQRHGGDPGFRLCYYFDLIAGTSTGSIIASALAVGMSVAEIRSLYQHLGHQVFQKHWLRHGLTQARYNKTALEATLRGVFGAESFGEDLRLADPRIRTGLLVVTKRLDTGSVWPLNNNPADPYFQAPAGSGRIANGDYPLWQVVRASSAAPTFFDPEQIQIETADDGHRSMGMFVDGGVSPYNNPSLQALLYATLSGYGLQWPKGVDKLLLVSVGTGRPRPGADSSGLPLDVALKALTGLMDDCGALVETVLQLLSTSPTAARIDREIGDLSADLFSSEPQLSYLRYDVALTREALLPLVPDLSDHELEQLCEMDNPAMMDRLLQLGRAVALARVEEGHFPAGFDLKD